MNMSAKEIKALIEVGTSMGYSGEELKQFLTEERMRLDKEREKQDKKAAVTRTAEERETNGTRKNTRIQTGKNSTRE